MSYIDYKESYQRIVNSSGKKTFYKTATHQYSYADVSQKIQQLSSYIKHLNIKKGDRVILSTKQDFVLHYCFLGLTLNGITVVMLDPDIKLKRATYIINLTEATHFIIDDKLVNEWQLTDSLCTKIELLKEKKKGKLFGKLLGKKKPNEVSKNTTFPALLSSQDAIEPSLDFDLNDIAYILFTSGTTANPKAVPTTYEMFTTHLTTMQNVYELNEDSNVLNFLNLYHTDGLFQGPILAFCNHVTLHKPVEFSVPNIGEILDYIYKEQISHFVTAPTMLALIDKYSDGYEDSFEHGKMTCLMCSTAPLYESLWTNFEQKFSVTIVNVYGLTETVSGGLFSGLQEHNRKIGSVGKPADCQIRIVDDNYNDVDQGSSGELLMKGKNVLSGYLNNEKATKEAFHDGWFKTGDFAKLDQDGFVYITGRKKNIIIKGGFNVQPEEVNEVLTSHPEILEAATAGLPHEILGEEVVSAIVTTTTSTQVNELMDWCRLHLEPHCVPSRIEFVKELPKGLSGKVKQEELKELLEQKPIISKSIQNDDLSKTILAIAAETFKINQQQLQLSDSSLSVDGWDSLAHLNFIVNLEEHFKIKLTTQEVMNLQTLADAQNLVLEK